MRTALRIAALLLPLLGSSLPVTARELYWESVDVRARLDAEGLLHIEERQAMVFTGDWNGGERTFRLLGGQRIKLHALKRVDPTTGREVQLAKGDLSKVDHYDWTDSTTLRWRSRLPSDPDFDHTRITYVLDYTLAGTLDALGDKAFALAPNFVFPDRAGPIEHFSLDFDIDPIWQTPDRFPKILERSDLQPGQDVVVAVSLVYTGKGWPASVPRQLPLWIHLLIFAAALAAMIWLALDLWRHETAVGRFDPPETPKTIDRGWLEEHVLSLAPEVAGALWDRAIGPPEVAAVLARLVGEGKLESEIVERPWFRGGNLLRLRRKVAIEDFASYDKRLVKGLFVNDGEVTDTDAVRKYYQSRKKGFDPTAVIRNELLAKLERALRQRLGHGGEGAKPGPSRTVYLLLSSLALGILAAVLRPEVHLVLGVLLIPAFLLTYAIGAGFAANWSRRVDWRGAAALGFLVPALVLWILGLALVMMINLIASVPTTWLGELAVALLPVAMLSSLAQVAKTREIPDAVRVRQRLAAARRLLQRELQKTRPDLEDTWFPYLLAFGLQGEVDRWFRAFGAVAASHVVGSTAGFTSASSSSLGSSSGGGWTGGGGSFGGAGATASWAAAAQGIASGVSAPSSSSGGSSGGGGGGGGGSSGGGGGGGW